MGKSGVAFAKVLWTGLRALAVSRRGNVAMMFGLALVPLTLAAGVGLDFARGMLVRQAMSEALDAASLAVGSTSGLSHDSALALAQQYFNANYKVDSSYGTPTLSMGAGGYNSTTGSVTITASDTMPTAVMRLVGLNTVPVSTSTTVVWGQSKLWVALVLDNSGSMSDGDSNGSKMDALKNAAGQLLTVLQNAAANPGDVQVSIVPFDMTVNAGTSNVNASWVGWTAWEAQPANVNLDGVTNQTGPGSSCPFTDSRNRQMSPYGYYCTKSPSNGSSTTSSIPSSGSYAGYICPGIDSGTYNTDHRNQYYNGCYNSVANTSVVSSGRNASCWGYSNCSCSGSGRNTVCTAITGYTHHWIVNAHSTWSGCIMDRDQDYDIKNTTPGSGSTLFPAVNPASCVPATITPLGYDWTTLSSQITAMQPNYSTNQAEGMAHGWQTLTPGDPYGAPAVPENTARYIILLSDGLNTEDRWWGDGYSTGTTQTGYIDTREKDTCDAAKADGVIIYTIFLDIGGAQGDSAPLQYCASDSSKYFDLTSTSAVVTTFNQIAAQITNVRVSR